jgi:hypothetical protein
VIAHGEIARAAQALPWRPPEPGNDRAMEHPEARAESFGLPDDRTAGPAREPGHSETFLGAKNRMYHVGHCRLFREVRR